MAPVLEAVRVSASISRPSGASSAAAAGRCAPSTASRLQSSAGKTLGVVGESRLRQDDDGQAGARPRTADRRRHAVRRQGYQELDAAGRRHYRKSVQAVFQDPYASLKPAHADQRDHRRAADDEREAAVGRGAQARAQAARPGRIAVARRRPLPARIFRRAAAAHRDRPRAGAVAAADRARRAGLGARRVDPRADPQPAARPPGRDGPQLSVHRPRPGGGRAYEPRRSW